MTARASELRGRNGPRKPPGGDSSAKMSTVQVVSVHCARLRDYQSKPGGVGEQCWTVAARKDAVRFA